MTKLRLTISDKKGNRGELKREEFYDIVKDYVVDLEENNSTQSENTINTKNNFEVFNNHGTVNIYNNIQLEDIPKNILVDKVLKEQLHIIYRDGYIEPRTVYVEELDIHVAVCPVTFEEYDLCFNSNNQCYAKNYEYESERKNYPVVNVCWNCANKYIEWLNEKTNKNYCLLSSFEWDHISNKDKLGKEDFDNYIWHKKNTKNKKIQYVAKKKVGNLGIYDLYGNVHEWCSDRFIRGNSFKYTLKNIFKNIDRIHLPNHTKDVLSFRIAIRSV